ncbi:MFS transporter [Sphingobium sp. SCG-1]|uniref:MFS transporter n=1 Tax=Sphingobium sp. SCG-1 TaxID=2072936 RepID=UPI0016710E3F|nr:MFS transporter [Sphingobium sp. SCG-1]
MFGFSFIDRLILSLLAPSIHEHLHISDTQLGILFGMGFGVVYALMGLPLAHLLDKHRRVPLVAAGVALWSLCTVASGFAPNFLSLIFLRSGVAIGEAVLSPAVISIIADLFPRDKRVLPTTIYTAVGAVMYTGALVFGGLMFQLATGMSASLGLEAWQITFVLVGLPGLLLAPLLLLTVPEPVRVGDIKAEEFATVSQAWAYFRGERRLYGGLFLGAAAISICNSAKIAWVPTLLIRSHGMHPSQAGYMFGTVGLLSGFIGAITWPSVVRFWTARGRKDALITVFAIALTISWICFGLVGFMRSLTFLFVAIGIGGFFSAALAVLVPILIQMVTPGRMRGRAMALYLTATGLVGLGLGPPLAALISDQFFKGQFAIGYGLAALIFVTGPFASLAIWSIRGPYRTALDKAEVLEEL